MSAAFMPYVLAVLLLTEPLYWELRGLGLNHGAAVYCCRKAIHVLAGGVTALLVPHIFTSPIAPASMALILALLLYATRRMGVLMYWFQVEENMNEVSFCIAWGLSLLILWLVLGDPRLAVLPPIFVSFGDAATGLVRAVVYGRRTKSWIGNLAMLAVTLPLGYRYGGPMGAAAAVAASLAERLEIPPIDDNILVPLSSSAVLLAARALDLV